MAEDPKKEALWAEIHGEDPEKARLWADLNKEPGLGSFRGAGQNVLSGAMGALTSAGRGLGAVIDKTGLGDTKLGRTLERGVEVVEEKTPEPVGRGFIPDVLHGLGSTGFFFLAAPGGLSGIATLGALSNGGQEYTKHLQERPGDEEGAWEAFLWGGSAGTLEAVPIKKIYGRAVEPVAKVLADVNQRTKGKLFRSILTDLAAESTEEALQEGLQSAVGEFLGKHLRGDELDVLEAALAVLQDPEARSRIGYSSAVGAAAVGPVSVLGSAVQEARVREAQAAVQAMQEQQAAQEAVKGEDQTVAEQLGVAKPGSAEVPQASTGVPGASAPEQAPAPTPQEQAPEGPRTPPEATPEAATEGTPETASSEEEFRQRLEATQETPVEAPAKEEWEGTFEIGGRYREETETVTVRGTFPAGMAVTEIHDALAALAAPGARDEIVDGGVEMVAKPDGPAQLATKGEETLFGTEQVEVEGKAPPTETGTATQGSLIDNEGTPGQTSLVDIEDQRREAEEADAEAEAEFRFDTKAAAIAQIEEAQIQPLQEELAAVKARASAARKMSVEALQNEVGEEFSSKADYLESLRIEKARLEEMISEAEAGQLDTAAMTEEQLDEALASMQPDAPVTHAQALEKAEFVTGAESGLVEIQKSYLPRKKEDAIPLEGFTHVLRAADDPKRSPRPKGGRKDKAPHLALRKADVEEMKAAMLKHLGDRIPRTFNRLSVELLDLTADVTVGEKPDEALMQLIDEGLVEHSLEAPILFRLAPGAKKKARKKAKPKKKPEPKPEGQPLKGPSVEQQRKTEKRRAAARKAQQKRAARYATGDLQTFIRSIGGLRPDDPNTGKPVGELDKLREQAKSHKRAPGLSNLIQKKGKGLTRDAALAAALEAGYFPTKTQGVADEGGGRQEWREVTEDEFLEALEANVHHPDTIEEEALSEEQLEQEREDARLQAAAEEAGMDPEEFLEFMRQTDQQLEEDAKEAGFEDDVEGYLAHLAATDEGDGVPFDPMREPPTWGSREPPDPLKRTAHRYGGRPIGGRLSGRLEQPESGPPKEGDLVSAPDVINALSKIVEAAGRTVPIRWGRMQKVQARGYFEVQPEVIRVQVANNIATATHEVGHALEKAAFGWERGGAWKKPRAGKKMQEELVLLGRRLYGNTKPAGGYKREGWAEFVRMWVTRDLRHPQTGEDEGLTKLEDVAPLTAAWFEQEFSKQHPEVRKAFDGARKLADGWREQGAQARARASIVRPKTKTKRALSQIQRAFSIEAWFEMGTALHKFSNLAGARRGAALKPEEDPFFLFQAYRMTHDARAEVMVRKGMIDLAGNLTGPSLEQIVEPMKGQMEEFTLYLWAQQALLYWNHRGRRDPRTGKFQFPQGRNPGLSKEDAHQIIEELDRPGYAIAAVQLMDWHTGVLNYCAQCSPAFREVVNRIQDAHPGYLIPLQREFEELDSKWAAQPKGGGSPVKRMKGSGRRIKDPFPVMIANARDMLLKGHQRRVLDQVIRLSNNIEGMGSLVVRVPEEKVVGARPSLTQVTERLRRRLFAQFGATLKVETQEGDEIGGHKGMVKELEEELDGFIGEAMAFLAPAPPANGDKPILPYWNGSDIVYYEVDGELFRVLQGMDIYRLPGIADFLIGGPARTFRLGTTGLRASFGLVTNPLRDLQTLYLNTRSSASAPRLAYEWVHRMILGGISQVTGKEIDPYREAALRLGVSLSQSLGQDVQHTKRAARQLFQGRTTRIVDPRNMRDFAAELFNFPELATRTVEFATVAKEVGWEPGQHMTESQAIQMLLASKQVSTDFTAAGEIARFWNQVAPFHNAALQGPRAHYRALRRKPWKFMLRGAQMTLLTLLLWWKHKDEEWYLEMPFRERFGFWHHPVTMPDGEKTLVRIPRAFEVGALFGALPEAIFDAMYRQDPEGVKAWMEHLYQVSTPPVTPPLLEEAFEQALNKDLYWDTPLVPEGEKRREPREQYNEYTSRVAVFMGDMLNVSPRRIEHAVGGIFGGVGRDLMQAVGMAPAVRARDAEAADIPIIGRMFQRGGELGFRPRSIAKLYDELGAATRLQQSPSREESVEDRQARLLLTDAARAVSALSAVRGQLTGREERTKLTHEAMAIARDAVAAAAKIRGGEFYEDEQKRIPIRSKFRGHRVEAEAREESLETQNR